MPHKVEISDKTFEDLRDFCKLNDLKIGQYADKLIRDGLMIEMYGDVPFMNYRKPSEIKSMPVKEYGLSTPKDEAIPIETPKPEGKLMYLEPQKVEIPVPDKLKKQEDIPPEIQKVIDEHFWDMLEDKKPDEPKYLEPSEETKARMIEAMEKIEAEHPQTYITNQEGEKEIQKEMLKQLGVPDKVVNKITKRRLK